MSHFILSEGALCSEATISVGFQEGLLPRLGGSVPSSSLTLHRNLASLTFLSFEMGSCSPILQVRIILSQHPGYPLSAVATLCALI